MSESAAKSHTKGSAPQQLQRAPAKAPAEKVPSAPGAQPGLLQRAGPALGLGVQRQVAVGEPGDHFEREADAVADRVAAGGSVQPAAISPVTADSLTQKKGGSGPGSEERKQEAKALQKVEAKPAEKKPDSKPVQKAAAAPAEKKPDSQPVHKAEAKPAAPVDKKPVQTDAAGGSGSAPSSSPSTSAAASHAIDSKGAGKPLEPATRGKLESGLGTDLSDVRVHDDSAARSSAQALNARAFTHGSDIWLGPGASQSDTHLMAHEATHVVQQSGGVHRRVQRAKPKAPVAGTKPTAAGASPAAAVPGGGATVDHATKKIDIPELRVPNYSRKADAIKAKAPLTLPKPKPARPNDQRDVWTRGVKAGDYTKNVLAHIDRKRGVRSKKTDKIIHVLQPKASQTYIIGDDDSIADTLVLPRWDSSGKSHYFDVDHLLEVQLGGLAANVFDNMELVDSSANRSSGALIHNEIVRKVEDAIAPEVGAGKHWSKMPDLDQVQNDYTITFATVNPALKLGGQSDSGIFWSRDQVIAGAHVEPLVTLTSKEISAKKLIGDESNLIVYPRPAGGGAHKIPWNPKTNTAGKLAGLDIFRNFVVSDVTYDPQAGGGTISGTKSFKKGKVASEHVVWKLNELEGFDYTTYVDRSSVLASVKVMRSPGHSPVELTDVDLDDSGGIVAKGVLRPDLPLLKGLEIDVSIDGDDLTLSKTFTAGDLRLPAPVQVTGSSLTIAAGTAGFEVSGDVNFEIERLGKGTISGMGHYGGDSGVGFGVRGSFELDKKVFDGEARIEAGYKKEHFWAKGHLSIGAGKIRGIKSASLDASFADETFSATGAVKPDIPAVEEAGLSIEYSQATGLKFSGDLSIKKGIPGLDSGSIHIEALKPPGSEEFKVKGSGSAKPNIPGIDSMLQVTYDDGLFDASITAAYNKGRLNGSILVGATNRPVTDGQPAGPPAQNAKDITVYGSGSLTVVIAPWLKGTVGVRLLPKGEIELSGEIAIPATLDVFPEKKLEKNIFTIGIDIPIVGVSVLGHNIGIFASIKGGLDVSAGIGPGQLQQLALKITYNPAHEEQTHVEGDASLHVPAHAGLRMFVRGGIGAGIPIVSAEAGLEIGAGLGLEGAIDTGVHVDWTPTAGLTLDANASIFVEPKLKVDLTGFVTVDADLLFSTVNLYEKRWQLAAFEYGSGLRFGVAFPVHYQEGQPFDVSLDQVKFQVPDIDPKAMLSDLIERIA